MSVRLSVVIPTYRRTDLLTECLQRLAQQSLDPAAYEIIVADDGPTEETAAVVRSFERAGGPRVDYVAVTATQGPAGARNAGWRAARSEIIAFTDDDCQPTREWLARGLAAIADADAVTGKTIVPLPEHPTDYERNVAGLATAEFITANCFVRRAALEQVGGFDERFTLAWREDSDLHFALLANGKRIVRCEEAVIVHPVRPARWGISLKQQRQSVFDPLLYRKHTALYRERVGPLPRSYYLAVASLMVAAGATVVQAVPIAVAAIGLWGAVTAWLTAKRLRNTSRAPSHVAEMLVTSGLIPLLSVYWRIRGALRFGTFYW
jgi:glycosyltransferase involved in cell wall biosynthesis